MYIPSDDTILLADAVEQYHGGRALEIGAGSCFVAGALRKNYEVVVACDIDFRALQYCKRLFSDICLVCCDAANAFRQKFDLIVSNPPYLPGMPEEDRAIYGGTWGIEKTIGFVESAVPLLGHGGAILIVVSSFSNLPSLTRRIVELRLVARTISQKKLFFETISVLEIK